MSRAVRFDRYGDVEVLNVVDVPAPKAGPGQVVVRMKAAGINPGEASIRKGLLHERWPATFPSGEGSDLAGVVAEVGEGVTGVRVGDEVIGFTNRRASHAELVLVEAGDLTPKPRDVSWEAAGALFVAGTTAYASVRAVAVSAGETVIVSGAAGGVGSLAVQLVRNLGARPIGIAGPKHHEWLAHRGVIPVAYGEGLPARLRTASAGRINAFLDTFGGGYVKLAMELGVSRERINTIIDFQAAREHGVRSAGSSDAATRQVLAELAHQIADRRLEVPIARVYPLSEVREAFLELEERHTLGKIVLVPD